LFGLIIFLVVAIVLFGLLTPVRTVECYRTHSFLINREFKEVRLAYFKQDLTTEVIEAHGGEVIEKNWIKHDFTIKMPLRSSWEYSGTMLVVAKLDYPSEIMHMKQTFHVRPDEIYAKSNLDRPLAVGVTDWDQELRIVPWEGKTRVDIRLYTRLSRPIPRVYVPSATKQMNTAADEMVANLTVLLKEQAMKDVGFIDLVIP
jgi:hypothetical protein